MNYTDRIKPTDNGITTYIEELTKKNYQIPTFQREVVWEKENVKKLWDSIYKFFPLGSILIWKTTVKLHNHREIGGHIITDETFDRNEFQYILDGQQRTTSLLTSLLGGKIEGKENFDPTLYIDLTIENKDEVDDESYKKRFLFWEEIDDRNGQFKANIGKKTKFDKGLIVKLNDIKINFETIQESIVNNELVLQNYNHPYWVELRKIKQVLDNYRLSFIELKGIQVSEVCQIFERINQAGKPLSIFDIVVAKTFRLESESKTGFDLRLLIDNFRIKNGNNNLNTSNFLKIDDLTYLQALATIIKYNIDDSGVLNITDRYLNDIKTEHIENIWESAENAFLKTFDFFENYLYLKSTNFIPYRYFYFTISTYFYKNINPDYDFLKKYFWFYSFHDEDLLSNTTHLTNHIDFLLHQKNNGNYEFPGFLIDKQKLRTSSYSSKGRISRAILSLLANQLPKDWKHTDRLVNAENFFFSTDKPNLHHVFPTSSEYILKTKSINKVDSNTLMNIVFLTQITNLEISNENPIKYLREYDSEEFVKILPSHLLPFQLIEWSRKSIMPENALDMFIELRIDEIINILSQKIPNFKVIDTVQMIDNS